MSVTELDGLLDELVRARDVAGARDENCRENQAADRNEKAGET
jgi:hypothetical protein